MEPREHVGLIDATLEQMHTSGTQLDTITVVGIMLSALLFLFFVAWVIHSPKKGIKMGRDPALAANAIVSGFNEAVLKKEMSAKTARYWMLRIGRECNIPDLVPIRNLTKKLHPYKITKKKEQIKHRLANGLYKEKAKLPADPKKETAREKAKKFLQKTT